MGNGKSTNKISRAIVYLAVGMAENSMSIVLGGGNIARKMLPVACWHWVSMGVTVCFICLNTEHPCGGIILLVDHQSSSEVVDPNYWVIRVPAILTLTSPRSPPTLIFYVKRGIREPDHSAGGRSSQVVFDNIPFPWSSL